MVGRCSSRKERSTESMGSGVGSGCLPHGLIDLRTATNWVSELALSDMLLKSKV